ncbi:hypothetical protein F5884DRAFT_888264 [Xylogone sp. PMI_703]|nr:hypothetical protein F5884DRAFT_888264 [Xylogone sp. PMI_703]
MEPGVYKRLTGFQNDLPPFIPIPEMQEQRQQQQHPTTRASSDPQQFHLDWTVDSMDIWRGSLGKQPDNKDPRMWVGWRSDTGPPAPAPSGTDTGNQQRPLNQPIPSVWTGHIIYGDQPSARANELASAYPHPTLSLPHPSLNLDFRMAVKLEPRISVGPTPLGQRNWIAFTGGTWSGTWGAGTVLPGGQDCQLVTPDGSARVETSYLLKTNDNPPAHIVIKTHGWRTGPPQVLAELSNPEMADKVDPNSYKFRLFIEMETGDERYRDIVNYGMWVGSGMRRAEEVVYE